MLFIDAILSISTDAASTQARVVSLDAQRMPISAPSRLKRKPAAFGAISNARRCMPRKRSRPPSAAAAGSELAAGEAAGADAVGADCALAETAPRSMKAPAIIGSLTIKNSPFDRRKIAYGVRCVCDKLQADVSNGVASAKTTVRQRSGKVACATLKNKLLLRYISNSLIAIRRWRYLHLSVILNAMESSDRLRPMRAMPASAGPADARVAVVGLHQVMAEVPIQCLR